MKTLTGWRRKIVSGLRASVLTAAGLDERIKWGHLDGDTMSAAGVRELVAAAIALNRKLGDPTAIAKARGEQPTNRRSEAVTDLVQHAARRRR